MQQYFFLIKSDLDYAAQSRAMGSQMGQAGEEGDSRVGCKLTPASKSLPLQPRGHMETLCRPVWCIPAHPPEERKEKKREERKKISQPNLHEIVLPFTARPPIDTGVKAALSLHHDCIAYTHGPPAHFILLKCGAIQSSGKNSFKAQTNGQATVCTALCNFFFN